MTETEAREPTGWNKGKVILYEFLQGTPSDARGHLEGRLSAKAPASGGHGGRPSPPPDGASAQRRADRPAVEDAVIKFRGGTMNKRECAGETRNSRPLETKRRRALVEEAKQDS